MDSYSEGDSSEDDWVDEDERPLVTRSYIGSRPPKLHEGGHRAVYVVDGEVHGGSIAQIVNDSAVGSVERPISARSGSTDRSSEPEFRQEASAVELKLRCHQLAAERSELQQQLHAAQAELQRLRAEKTARLRDDYFVRELLILRNDIRKWTTKHFRGEPKRQKWPGLKTSKEIFGNLTDNYTSYLDNSYYRPLLIQTYLWNVLQGKVFHNRTPGCGYIWAGKFGDRKLRALDDTLRLGMFSCKS